MSLISILSTNVVDVLYAGFPAILYLNPSLGQYLLRPILETQVSNGALVGQAYAPQNLGSIILFPVFLLRSNSPALILQALNSRIHRVAFRRII